MQRTPELRLIEGEHSPRNRFRTFIETHSTAIEEPSELARYAIFTLASDPGQYVPVDEVEFKVMRAGGVRSSSVALSRGGSFGVYEVVCDTDGLMPDFYDERRNEVPSEAAIQLIDLLAAAEQAGRLRPARD